MGTSVTVVEAAPAPEQEPAPVITPVIPEPSVTLDLAQEVGRMGAVLEQVKTDLSEVRQMAESAKYLAENPIIPILEPEQEPEPITEIPVAQEPESVVVDVQATPRKPRGLLDWIL